MIIENGKSFNSDIPEIKRYIFNKKSSAKLMEIIAVIRTEKGLPNDRPLLPLYERISAIICNERLH